MGLLAPPIALHTSRRSARARKREVIPSVDRFTHAADTVESRMAEAAGTAAAFPGQTPLDTNLGAAAFTAPWAIAIAIRTAFVRVGTGRTEGFGGDAFCRREGLVTVSAARTLRNRCTVFIERARITQ